MHDMKNIRAHTILFTEDCPLDCRYCQLKTEDDYGTNKGQTFDFILEKIKKYDEEDKKDGVSSQLTFTGGEPFLYWNWIKQIIEMYGDRFVYHFNTSGYLFTEEILEFLSHYQSYFTLSIDGGEKLTNYLRPVKSNPYGVGYFKKIKEITPILMYYFPNTSCKIIINNRYVDLLHDIYLDMEKAGFQSATLILDFNARPSYEGTHKKNQRLWDENDTKILEEQMELIVKEILLGFENNVIRMKITNIEDIINFLMLDIKDYSPDNLVCNVFKGRTLETLNAPKDSHCFEGRYDNLEQAKEALINRYKELNGKCPIDSTCKVFNFCANRNCPISSLTSTGDLFGADQLECIMNKIIYKSALQILSIANELYNDKKAYLYYLNNFDFLGKKEVIDSGHTTTLLSL